MKKLLILILIMILSAAIANAQVYTKKVYILEYNISKQSNQKQIFNEDIKLPVIINFESSEGSYGTIKTIFDEEYLETINVIVSDIKVEKNSLIVELEDLSGRFDLISLIMDYQNNISNLMFFIIRDDINKVYVINYILNI